MKSIHLCIPEMLEYIKKPEVKIFFTYRTGFVPYIYEDDIVRILERTDKKDIFLFNAKCLGVSTLLLIQMRDMFKGTLHKHFIEEEIAKYNRTFHKNHWFFQLKFEKITEGIENFL